MTTIEKSVVIDALFEKVFNFASDNSNLEIS